MIKKLTKRRGKVGGISFILPRLFHHGGLADMIVHVIKNLNQRNFNDSGEEEGGFNLDLALSMILTTCFILLYVLLAVLYLWVGVKHEKIGIKLTLKCLPLVALILWFTAQWSIGVGLCNEGVRGVGLTSEFKN